MHCSVNVTNIMSEAHDRQHAPKHAWCKAIPHVMQTATLLYVQDSKVHAAMVTAQERHCSVSIEEAERYASPVNCWLMTPLPQEVLIVLLLLLCCCRCRC